MSTGSSLRFGLLARCSFPPPGTPLDCAVSGGPDSLALLALATAAECDVTAWHVDHGLRPGSGDDVGIVEAAARRYGAAVRSVSVSVPPGPNLEARARQARFAALPAGICTGHTADDQAETLLLALLRGAGIDGIAGMAPGGHPLLAIRRAETLALCEEEGLDPVVDRTNDDTAFRRNAVRHQLIPLASRIADRDVVPLLARTAALVRSDAEVLDTVAGDVDPTDADALNRVPAGVARRAIRAWIVAATPEGRPPYPPDAAAVERILAVARGEAVACEVAGIGRVSRHRRRLTVEPVTSP